MIINFLLKHVHASLPMNIGKQWRPKGGGHRGVAPPPGIEKKIDRMKRAYSKYIINFSLGGNLSISESPP